MAYKDLSKVQEIQELTGNEEVILTGANTKTKNGRLGIRKLLAWITKQLEDLNIKRVEDVLTMDELRTKVGVKGQLKNLLGYYTAGDKPSLLYEWVEGVGEDDGGSVIVVGEGYWKALFGDSVDVRDFGVKPNGENVNKININKSIEFVKKTNKSKIIFGGRSNDEYYLIGYLIKIPTGISVITEVDLVSPNTYKGVFLSIGSYEINNFNIEVDISVRKQNTTDWEDKTDTGVEIINIVESSKINIRKVQGFTTGVRIVGDSRGVAYNVFNINKVINCRYQVVLTNKNKGWCNENIFHIHRLTNTAQTHTNKSREGIVITSDDRNYYNNNNVFIKPCIEIGSNEGQITKAINIEYGSLNSFTNIRNEGNSKGTKKEKVYYVENESISNSIEEGWGTFSKVVKNIEDYSNNTTLSKSKRIEHTYTGDKILLEKIHFKYFFKEYDDINVYSSLGIYKYNESNKYDYLDKIEITDTGVKIKDSTIGIPVKVNTKNNKRFIISVNTTNSNKGRIRIKCFDEQGVVLGNDKKYVNSSSNTKLDFFITYYNSWTTGSDTVEDLFISVREEVSYIEVILTGGTQEVELIDLFIYSLDFLESVKANSKKILKVKNKPNKQGYLGEIISTEDDMLIYSGQEWSSIVNKPKYYTPTFSPDYSQNQAFGEATLIKKGNEVFYKMLANKSTEVAVGDTVFTLQPELRPKTPEFIVGHGGNGAIVVWLMIEPTTGAVKVQEFQTEGSVTTTNAIVMSGSFFIKEY